MNFERWNALVQEQLRKKEERTPPQPAKEIHESEVEQVGQIQQNKMETT